MTTEEKYDLLKKRYNFTDKYVAEKFGYKTVASFWASSRKWQTIAGIVSMYELMKGEISDLSRPDN